MLEVKEVKAEETYPLRHSILRPHQRFEDCIYDTDQDEGVFHVGAFYDGKLVTVASFYPEELPDVTAALPYRLRAMATVPEYRKLGAGRAVVTYAENKLKQQGVDLLWCKGRTSVEEYYVRLGFHAHGDVFDYPPIGPHIVMMKKLEHG
ncbi:GNAT family N-acetyltransferase [Sutcliffiella sp. NC1]|uniref:GNAT family N-acetyltransferase n=1 Tax=Sutcliffiella sp. NC1 TaxID=3004096 RepID=UPI0022DE3701|nr:GNAT family N-acetyltransferase [Sutcliffiella sp. NC1]WBL14901.1 GNAT family N-acetyltransferase [Sutcliffiella sp. NC1]